MVLFALVVLGMMRLYPLGLAGIARTVVAGRPSAWRVFRPRIRRPLLSQHTARARPDELPLINSGTRPSAVLSFFP
jgi:hypothetical protein